MTTPTTTTADALATARAARQVAEDAARREAAARDDAWQRLWNNESGSGDAYQTASDKAEAARNAFLAAEIVERQALADHHGGVLAERVLRDSIERAAMTDDLAAALTPIVSYLAGFDADQRQALKEARAAGIGNGENYGRFLWTRGFQGSVVIKTDGNSRVVTDYRSELLDMLVTALGQSGLTLAEGSNGEPAILTR